MAGPFATIAGVAAEWQLAIESSTAQASVAAGPRGRAELEAVLTGSRQSEILMDPLGKVLNQVPKGEGLRLVIVGTGPGSYNGARVGIAAGQGVALTHDCPTVGLCSLEALEPVRAGTPCLAVGDARRGSFSAMVLREGRLSGEPELLEEEAFVARVEAALSAGERIVTMEDPERLPEVVRQHCHVEMPVAGLLLHAWAARGEEEQQALLERPPQPFYLRPPYVTKPAGS